MKLFMNRNGDFKCNWNSTENMCGTIENLNPIYSYACVIETGDILDTQDFVFDQLNVDKYFQEKYKEAVVHSPSYRGGNHITRRHAPRSCERIAIDAVNDIRRMLEKHMLSHADLAVIYRIAVTISFGPKHAAITAEWVPDAAKPVAAITRKKPEPTVPIFAPRYDSATIRKKQESNQVGHAKDYRKKTVL